MFKFNAGAPRPANDDARLNAANDLVRRTLTQHGLMGGDTQAQPQWSGTDMMTRLQAQMQGFGTQAGPADHQMQAGQFTCDSGSRNYLTHVPASAADGASGIIVMLHGCTQNPADFAAGTAMNTLADRHGFVVVYPQQARGDNAQSCWNWFSRNDQRRDRGEPAILSGLARKIAADHGVGADKTYVAGLSAGAAMAVILGETYPDVFAAVGAHSGLPFGAAKDVTSAFAAMAGNAAEPLMNGSGSGVRTIVFHGTSDTTVHPSNGDHIARHALSRSGTQTIETEDSGTVSGRAFTRRTSATNGGVPLLEHWVVDGLAHAWSGGKAAGSYTDTKGPDASAEMVRFFFDINEAR